MSRILTAQEWAAELAGFRFTAFRLELQPQYLEPSEAGAYARFLAGDAPAPLEIPGLRKWYAQVTAQVATGKRVERVRVHDDPPTDYQRWERWLDGVFNTPAGEHIRYMTRHRANEVGLLPAAGNEDWWLLDSSRLVVMRFDDTGRRVENERVDDPERVVQACHWRDLATYYSRPDASQGEDMGRWP